jgi:hypothetical protein
MYYTYIYFGFSIFMNSIYIILVFVLSNFVYNFARFIVCYIIYFFNEVNILNFHRETCSNVLFRSIIELDHFEIFGLFLIPYVGNSFALVLIRIVSFFIKDDE